VFLGGLLRGLFLRPRDACRTSGEPAKDG